MQAAPLRMIAATTGRSRKVPTRKGRATARDAPPFLDDYLPYLLGNGSFFINKDFDRYVRAFEVSPLEWRVLASLSDTDGLTIDALAKKWSPRSPPSPRRSSASIAPGWWSGAATIATCARPSPTPPRPGARWQPA
jgi:hypothetical protein